MRTGKPRWFRESDRSPSFMLERGSGRVAPPAAIAGRGGRETVTLYASGDIIWERDLMERLLTRPLEHPFRALRELWADGDVVFGQLETCFGISRAEHLRDKRISYLSDPRLLPHFAAGGFDIAAQASNHSMDNGLEPVLYTRRALAELGIASCGSGADLAEARRPAIIERKGRKIALLAYNTDDLETSAKSDRPGHAPFVRELVLEDVRACRERAEIVIVSVHKGREFVEFPSPEHQADCRAIIDGGADLILGHHPHVMQGIEWRRRPDGRQGLIFYCLGSLLVDYEPPLSRYELGLFRRSQANNFVARIELGDAGVSGLRLIPVRQADDDSVRIESEAEAAHTWERIERCSHPLNHEAACDKFYVAGWPYLHIQHTSSWMHIRQRPAAAANYLRWLLREETVRLHWGALFGRDMPEGLLRLRRALIATFRVPYRLLRRGEARRAPA